MELGFRLVRYIWWQLWSKHGDKNGANDRPSCSPTCQNQFSSDGQFIVNCLFEITISICGELALTFFVRN